MPSPINKAQLLNDLKVIVTASIDKAEQLSETPNDLLIQTPGPGAWNIVQIIEHLNTYNAYYLPLISEAFHKRSPLTTPQILYRPGRLGSYFVKLMEPTEGKVKKKMKAARKHLPQINLDAIATLKTFIAGQHELIHLLEKAHLQDIENLSTSISILPLIRLRIGDVFRFIVTHQQRHFVQIEETNTTVLKTLRTTVL